MANDLSEIRQVPDPVTARSLPWRTPPTPPRRKARKTSELLMRAKRQYQAACTGEDRLRKDMEDDRRFRLGRLGDEEFPMAVRHLPGPDAREAAVSSRPTACRRSLALARNAVLGANLRPNVQPVDDQADVKTADGAGRPSSATPSTSAWPRRSTAPRSTRWPRTGAATSRS